MAKVSKVDSCMFCGNVPCTCNAKPKAPPKAQHRSPVLNRKCQCGHIADRHGGDKDCMECDCMAFVPIVRKSNIPSIPSSSSPPSEKADIHSAMRAAAKVHHVGETVKADNEAIDEIAAIKDDPELSAALRAVEPLMHTVERKRFSEVLNEPPAPAERALVWKRRVAGE